MRFELTKFNIDKASNAVSDIGGRDIMVNDLSLSGVKNIVITEGKEFLDDLDNEGTDIVNIIFEFENGQAYQSFRPDTQHCEISFETETLWIFIIEDLKKYLEREKFDLEFRLKEYHEAMSK